MFHRICGIRRNACRTDLQEPTPGVAITVPLGWRIEACGPKTYDDDREHCLLMWSSEDAPIEQPEVVIHVRGGTLEDGLRKEILFEQVNGKWVKHGKFTTSACGPIHAQGWEGIYGVADCGVFDELGQHLGECLTAVLSDGHRYVEIEAAGNADNDLVLAQIVQRLIFLP
jgi:hypothetical protein